MQMQKGSKDHVLARADYFKGLVSKTTDPVYWPEEKIREAIVVLLVAETLDPRRYEAPLAMAQIAMYKAL